MERHFTATAYVLHEGKALLLFHQKLGKWLPPGGHVELNETPPEAAIREAKEETGLDIAIIKQENIWVENWNASSFERPYMCLLENIPVHKTTPAHQHIDLIYLARPCGGKELPELVEAGTLRWLSLEEIEAFKSDVEIFAETKNTLQHLLKKA
jgi:8-oxo-dGTP pyrophosphatase MutT (NUDIX family)